MRWGRSNFCHHKKRKKRKEEKEVKEEKINKNGWDAASELQLKNRLEKKIKEIEREKKLKKEN